MDPLTISTGVITILQATNAIISVCYNFRAASKNAPWSLTKLVLELKSLRDILERLEELTHNDAQPWTLQKAGGSMSFWDQNDGLFTSCLQELDFVEGKIMSIGCPVTAPSSKRKSAVQALRWELKEKDANECLQRIERCKSSLSLALNYDQTMLLLRIQESSDSVHGTSQSIENKITKMKEDVDTKNLRIVDEKMRVLRWLSPVEPFENHETAVSLHEKGTSSWFFRCIDFEQWYHNKASFLWLTGIPGAGKTVLFSSIVSHVTDLRKRNGNLDGIAYFYCDFTRNEAQDARNVVGSLLAQLCAQVKVPEKILSAYRQSVDLGQNRRPTWNTLKEGFQAFATGREFLILVDALDEVENPKELLQYLSWMQQNVSNIGILVTSRASSEIEESLQNFRRFRLESHTNEVEHDIETYIGTRLNKDSNLSRFPIEIRDEIQEALLEKCGGMFRWAQCQLDALSPLGTKKLIRQTLHQLPKDLNEVYANILRRVRDHDLVTLRSALLWIGISVLPLTVEQLGEAVAMERDATTLLDIEDCRFNDPNYILKVAGCLLSVTDSGHVRFAHLSVKEYLLSNNILEDPHLSRFHLDLKQANSEITHECIAYLSLDILATGPAETQAEWDKRLQSLPLLKHVSKAWTYYLREATPSSELDSLVLRLFSVSTSSAFMSWIQVLNSDYIYNWDEYPRHATPLYYAASFGLNNVVDQLLEEGVCIDAPGSRFGGTALHGATLREHAEIVHRLLRAGAHPSKADFNSVTPLHTAAKTGNPKIMKLLLEYGASKEARDTLGKTPSDWALAAEKVVSQKLLRGEDCDWVEVAQEKKDSPVYERSAASFPALAVAQGLAPSSSLAKL